MTSDQLVATLSEPVPVDGPVALDPIVEQLRDHRVTNGISQAAIAARIGTCQSAVSMWEGGGGITLASVRRWANATGWDLTLTPLRQPEADA